MMEHEIYRLPRARLDDLVGRRERGYRGVAPVARGDVHSWEEVRRGSPIALDYPTTMLPPRAWFAPRREVLFRFKRVAGRYEFEAPPAERPLALIGVHGCDLTGLRVMRSFHESS